MTKLCPQPLTPQEGTAFLKKYGVKCANDNDVNKFLQTESLIRFVGYARVFKDKDFESLKKIYYLDSELRNIFMSAIERVEVQLRNFLVAALSTAQNDPLGHRKPVNFQNKEKQSRWLSIVDKKISASEDDLIGHYRKIENFPQVPAWVAVEVLSFDMLAACFDNLSVLNKAQVSRSFGVNGNTLSNWLDSLTFIRNKCAHQNQILGKRLPKPVKTDNLQLPQEIDEQNPLAVLYLLEKLLSNIPVNIDFIEIWKLRTSNILPQIQNHS